MNNKETETKGFFETLNVDKEEFVKKNTDLSTKIVLKTITEGNFSLSDIAKEISENFTTRELIASAALYSMKITEEALEAKKEDLQSIISKHNNK
jgi:hypothetical protein